MSKENSVNESKKKLRSDKYIQFSYKSNGVDKLKETVDELSEAIILNPKEFKLYFHRATLKLNIGDIAGAREDFKMCEMLRRKISGRIDDYPYV